MLNIGPVVNRKDVHGNTECENPNCRKGIYGTEPYFAYFGHFCDSDCWAERWGHPKGSVPEDYVSLEKDGVRI